MAKHAVLSPSSAKRWMSCPGSVILSEGIKDSSSSYADEGTAAHFLAAHCLVSGENASMHVGRDVLLLAEKATGSHFEVFFGELEQDPEKYQVLTMVRVDADMAEHVQVYLDYVRDVVTSTGGELLVEVAVPLDHMTGEEGATGTSDAIVVTPTEIIVIDLKFGRGVEVSAEGNPQMLMYASGARKLFELGGTFETIRTAISQPRITKLPSEWSCEAQHLDAFEAEVVKASQRIESGDATCVPSEDACKWCKAKANCKALDDAVQELMLVDFENMPAELPGISTVNLGKRMDAVGMVEDWCKAVRATVEAELVQGHKVEGYKLVQGRAGTRKWSDEEAAEAKLKSMRIKAELMYNRKLISPTDAEKLLKGDKKWEKLQEFITRADGKPSVAPLSDKRPALTVGSDASDFDVV